MEKIQSYLATGEFKYFASTVMPGMQIKQAIPFSKKIRNIFPDITIIWGGYFASNQYKVSINSGFVDFIINGPGDTAFPSLIDALEKQKDYSTIDNLIYKNNNEIIKTKKSDLLDQDSLPQLPYDYLNSFYPISKYLGKTFLGNKTAAYHSSVGCPFTCSFCAVVPIYEARWKGRSAENIFNDLMYLKTNLILMQWNFTIIIFLFPKKELLSFPILLKIKT